jgi:hypothetical protein
MRASSLSRVVARNTIIEERYDDFAEFYRISAAQQKCRRRRHFSEPHSRGDGCESRNHFEVQRLSVLRRDWFGHRISRFQACLLHHLDQNLSGFCRVAHFSQECNASASHTIVRFHTHMKPKSINCDHRCFLRFNASKFPGKGRCARPADCGQPCGAVRCAGFPVFF